MNADMIEDLKRLAEDFEIDKEVIIKEASHLPAYTDATVKIKEKIEINLNKNCRLDEAKKVVAHEYGHVKFSENHKTAFNIVQLVTFPLNLGVSLNQYLQLPYFVAFAMACIVYPHIFGSYFATSCALHFLGEYGANREANKRGFNLGLEYLL